MRLMGQPAPWLHEEVARRMAQRLAILKRAPRHIVDWGAHLGASEAALRAACPRALRVPVEAFLPPAAADARAALPPPWWSTRRWWTPGHAPTWRSEAVLAEGEADLLWSNMVLHHLGDPQGALARWLRLLSKEGILMFSTLGPGTLESLRRIYATHRWAAPHAPFVDMHDLGDMLVQAGFADPVMDQEVVKLTWASAAQALAELRQLGGNVDLRRHGGLRTPRWRSALEQAMSLSASGARVTLEFEVVYGHAVRPPPRAKLTAETAVPLSDMRGMLRSRRSAGGAPS